MVLNMKNGHMKLINDLNTYIENLIYQNIQLKDKVNKWNKDDEIQRLEDEKLDLIRRSIHILSSQEQVEINDFSRQHYESCKGDISYTFIGTSIGMRTKVKCTTCLNEKDVTDIDNW